MDFQPTKSDIVDYSIIIFRECKSAWNIDSTTLSSLIEKYSLASLLGQHFNYFNSMGNAGVVEELEDHIKEQGGHIHGTD